MQRAEADQWENTEKVICILILEEFVASYKPTCSSSSGMSLRFCSSANESGSSPASLADERDSVLD